MVTQNGIILPSTEDINRAISQLIDGLIHNEEINTRFRANPVAYFSSIGIASDGIPELMAEIGLKTEAAVIDGCWLITCWNTCTFTLNPLSVVLKATARPLDQ